MDIRVCIPSYKRPKVETLSYLPFATVWVDHKEYDDYIKANVGFEDNIISCEEGIQGNTSRIQNHILDTSFEDGADAVLIVDDDMKGIYHFIVNEQGGTEKVKLPTEEVLPWLEKYSILCDEFGFKLWGLNVNPDPLNYRHYSPFSTIGFIGGPFQCHLKNPLRNDERLPLKEDYDLSLQHCNMYRGVLKLNAFHYDVKQSEQSGGCASIRNHDKEMQQLEALIKKWGNQIVKVDNGVRHGTKRVRKNTDYNPIIKVPIKGI